MKPFICFAYRLVNISWIKLQNQSPSDKRRWSFRKRSARHRVLNTVITEVPSTIKESPESANPNLQTPDTSIVAEKIPPMQCTDEKLHLSTLTESKAPETIVVTKDEGQVDVHLEESLVIVIQAAVRGILARRELLKLKNVVKLQAAARGHLVRQHALETLRCIHAIVKMQTLVRARRAPLFLEDSYTGEKFDAKQEKTVPNASKEILTTKPHLTYEKLLRNSFARQLMASTPKTRPIHIKCDPMRPNDVWNWLQRWMVVLSAEPTLCPEVTIEQLEREKNEKFSSPVETKETSEYFCEMANSKTDIRETILPSEDVETLMTSSTDRSQASHLDSSSVEPRTETIVASDLNDKSVDINFSSDKHIESDMKSQMGLGYLPCKPEIEREQPDQLKHSLKRFASEQLETEGKKFNFGSEKVSNPAFIAAQSKFEELSLTTNANRLLTSSGQDGELESKKDTVLSDVDSIIRQEEFNVMENLGPHNSRGQNGGSECGTELSITSTLDSPDRSEIGGVENEVEAKVSDEESIKPNSKKDADVEGKSASTEPTSSMFKDQPEKGNDVEGESEDSFLHADCTQTDSKPEISASDVKRMLDSETGGPVYRSDPEASPRSHVTVPESQGTPSSQISGAAKMNRTEKSTSNHKRKSVSAGKKSPSNPNQDSGARSTVKQFPKDQKIGRRRNSFGSTRPQPADQEPRDSSSSNSLPHFMQATESARAKIHANNSPRSSPDMQDRDYYIKKRHSLPGANGRQGSPRVQQSMTQPQQAAKGNGGYVVHEHKWQR
uniref:Uncharacterized protein MANES_18G016100 n=1 Tax=Rhizophora mucronata TaxID=61149 RepID=A0A2P2JG42_RHIMU